MGASMRATHVAGQLAAQADACAAMGSPLYGALLSAAADDCRAGGPVWDVLRHDVRPGRGDAVALRFMAAVHRLVLLRQEPRLAVHYPSVGGTPGPGVWPAFREVVAERAAELIELTARPCQTNEVGRCAPLAWGFLQVAAATGLPLRCLEVGASAGLNLRWDRFRYGVRDPVRGTSATWGPEGSPVDLVGLWTTAPPGPDGGPLDVPGDVVVAAREGCDLEPVDPTSPEGRLAVSASVWADMTDRFTRLGGALREAAQTPATVDRAALDTWTARRLAESTPGVATVVFHSVVAEYVPPPEWARFVEVLDRAGARADDRAPLAWVRLEPFTALRRHALSVTTWPGGATRVVATSGPHGQDVRPVDPDRADELAARAEAEVRAVRG